MKSEFIMISGLIAVVTFSLLFFIFVVGTNNTSTADCPGPMEYSITETDTGVTIQINCIPGQGGTYQPTATPYTKPGLQSIVDKLPTVESLTIEP